MANTIRTTFILIIMCLTCLALNAQIRPSERDTETGSISGQVTFDGKPLARLRISLEPAESNDPQGRGRQIQRGQTDSEGRFHFTRLPAGAYRFFYFAPHYIHPSSSAGIPAKEFNLDEGEQISNVNITLQRGGVITGRITDSAGRPLIEQMVHINRLNRVDGQTWLSFNFGGTIQTDDRGIYRAMGLAPGSYIVSAGMEEESRKGVYYQRTYPRTYHPDVQDAKQATVIEVRGGDELTGVDIRLGHSELMTERYVISGRAVDADTGTPIANLPILCKSITAQGALGAAANSDYTNDRGEFRLVNIANGRYGVLVGIEGTDMRGPVGYSNVVSIQVQDGDMTGIELRVKRSGSIAGSAVFESATDSGVLDRLIKCFIFASIDFESAGFSQRTLRRIKIESDGKFRLDGVPPGKVSFGYSAAPGIEGIYLLRVERDGIVLADGLAVQPGEQIEGIRFIFAYGNGVVRGQIIVNGVKLPDNAMVMIIPHRLDGSGRSSIETSAYTDSRGYFVLPGLIPGRYELEASIGFRGPIPPDWQITDKRVRQRVEIAPGQTVQVTIRMDLSQ